MERDWWKTELVVGSMGLYSKGKEQAENKRRLPSLKFARTGKDAGSHTRKELTLVINAGRMRVVLLLIRLRGMSPRYRWC